MDETKQVTKPDCYKCVYRGKLIGDAHSQCRHPDALMRGGGNKLGVKGDSHGISRGWFFWPVNFDPVWLVECEGYTPKEAKK